jgi:hypothetical protein
MGQVRPHDQGLLGGQPRLTPSVPLEAACLGFALGVDRGAVSSGLGQRRQGVRHPRGGQQAMVGRTVLGLPLHHGGLGAPILVERRGGWRNPALPGAPRFPPRPSLGERLRPLTAVACGPHLVVGPQGPVAVGIGAKAAIEPPHGPSPRGQRHAEPPRHGGHGGA